MESEMQILAYVGGALLLLVIYTVWGMIRMQTPTRGRAIDAGRRPGEALVVIDVQKDFTSPATYDPVSVEQALSRINALAADARDSGIPVLNVRHVFKGPYVNLLVRLLSGGRGAAGSPGLGTDPRLQLGASAEFLKHRGDAFANPQFGEWLDRQDIGKLIIVGLDGNACVKSTADGALNRGYRVEIHDDAVLSSSAAGWTGQKARLKERGASIAA
jgi:nicotinamidase-related amidase